MQYLLLINLGPQARDFQNMSKEDQERIAASWGELNQTPGVTAGLGLQPPQTATTVRRDGGKLLVTDGPFVESKEALDGYCIVEADDLDAALEVAAKVPALDMGGAVEVRPVAQW